MALPISVIIPAYNAAGTIATAVRSAAAQHPAEIIVVDDGSRDQTAAIASEAGAAVLQIANRGPGGARNAGIDRARGAWIALLDADDWWMPGKLERQLQAAGKDVGLIATLSDRPCHTCPERVTLADLWRGNPIVCSAVLMRQAAWASVGGFNEDRRVMGVEDYNLWLRIARSGWGVRCVQEVLTHYNMDGTGLSANIGKQLAAEMRGLDSLPYDGWPGSIRAKRAATLDGYARVATWHRDMPLARRAALHALTIAPSPARAAALAKAMMPVRALDGAARWLHGGAVVGAGD